MGFSLPAPDPDPGDFAAGAFAQYPHGGQASWRFLHRVWPRFDQSFESKKHVAEMLQLWPWPNSYNWEYVMIYNQLVIGVRIPVITVKGHNFSFFPVFFWGGTWYGDLNGDNDELLDFAAFHGFWNTFGGGWGGWGWKIVTNWHANHPWHERAWMSIETHVDFGDAPF